MLPEFSFRKKSSKPQKSACPLLCWDSARQQWGDTRLDEATRQIKERAISQVKKSSDEESSLK
ncbi:hypothetical protein [Rhodoflexus sp.]